MNRKDHLKRLGLKEKLVCNCGCRSKGLTPEDYQLLANDPMYQEDLKKKEEEYKNRRKDRFNKLLEEVYHSNIDRKKAPYITELELLLKKYKQDPTIPNELRILSFVNDLVELFKEFYVPMNK